jgi:hypothetical protein
VRAGRYRYLEFGLPGAYASATATAVNRFACDAYCNVAESFGAA